MFVTFLARISTPAGATSNLEVVIHKHPLAVTNFAILTKRFAGNQSEPKSSSHIQKSLSSTLTRGHILFTVSQKQCIKEKIFPRGCGLFCCMCLWKKQFHTKKQGHKDICGQFFLHGTQRKQVFFNKLKYLPHICVDKSSMGEGSKASNYNLFSLKKKNQPCPSVVIRAWLCFLLQENRLSPAAAFWMFHWGGDKPLCCFLRRGPWYLNQMSSLEAHMSCRTSSLC